MIRRVKQIGVVAVALMGSSSVVAQAANRRPNIVVIMTDDHASQAVSCYGGILSKTFQTPNIDRLAKEGMRLDNVFCTNSICSPSRASILTGKFSHVHGVRVLHSTMKADQVTYPQLLQKAGYRTAMIGKWHLRSTPSGFDHYKVLHKQGVYFDAPFSQNGTEVQSTGYVTDVITDDSIAWIKANKNKPFCVMVHHKAPHRPCIPHPKYQDLLKDVDLPEPQTLLDDYATRSDAIAKCSLSVTSLKRVDYKIDKPIGLEGNALKRWAYQTYFKEYLRTVASVDEGVGRILDCLDEEGLRDDTIVIYTSDQGFFLGEHGLYDKRFFYEESARMPFLIRYPGTIEAGSVADAICMNVDFAPTFLDYAGVAAPAGVQGKSMRPVLEGKSLEGWQDAAYYHLFDGGYGVPKHYAVRTDTYKLIHFYGSKERNAWELYNLKKDPTEVENLIENVEYASVVAELKKKIKELQERYGYDDALRSEIALDSERPLADFKKKKKKKGKKQKKGRG